MYPISIDFTYVSNLQISLPPRPSEENLSFTLPTCVAALEQDQARNWWSDSFVCFKSKVDKACNRPLITWCSNKKTQQFVTISFLVNVCSIPIYCHVSLLENKFIASVFCANCGEELWKVARLHIFFPTPKKVNGNTGSRKLSPQNALNST